MEKNVMGFPDINNIKFIYKKTDIQIINKNGQPFLFQGSKGLLNSPIKLDTNYIWINYFVNTEKKQKMFHFLKLLELHILEYLHKFPANSNISKLHPFYYDMGIGGQIQNYNGKQILDIYRTPTIKMMIDDFPEKSYVIPLIWVQGLHYKHDRWYLNIKIVQLMVIPIFIKFGKCLIDMDTSNIQYDEQIHVIHPKNDITNIDEKHVMYKDHPMYGKYFKMMNIGVPKPAIMIKMKVELGENIIDIMDKQPTDICIIKQIKRSMHCDYIKYFKMKMMGIPLGAIHHKMIMDNIDIHILDNPDEMIDDISIIKSTNTLCELISGKQLKKNNEIILRETHYSLPLQQVKRIDMNELLSKRLKIINTQFI
jgi:hypothetical protein